MARAEYLKKHIKVNQDATPYFWDEKKSKKVVENIQFKMFLCLHFRCRRLSRMFLWIGNLSQILSEAVSFAQFLWLQEC